MRARGAMPLTRADARAEQRRVDGVAGDDRRDVRAVAVGVFRRAELAGVELVLREEAVRDRSARRRSCCCSGVGSKPFAGLAGAREADRRVVDEPVGGLWRYRVQSQRPSNEVLAHSLRHARGVAVLRVEQRRMIRRDAAVDDADDDVLAAQLEIGAQAADRILQAEEGRAVVGVQVLVRVLPDALDLGALREPRYLRRPSARAAKPLTE